MDGSSSRTGTVVVALVVGVAIGYFISKATVSTLDRCHTKGDHTVIVGLDGALDCPEVEIGQTNTVSWQAPAGTVVRITYSDPSVFNGASCATSSCFSGRPTVVWKQGETQKWVDYTLTLTGGTQSRPTAGRIIIDK